MSERGKLTGRLRVPDRVELGESPAPEIRIVRVPDLIGIAMTVAPLVRRGIVTDAEGRWLVELRYQRKRARLSPTTGTDN